MSSLLQGPLDPSGLSGAGRHEMRGGDGSVLPHWQGLHETLTSMEPRDIRELRRESARLLEDDGVTYNVPRGGRRLPWRLDPIPLIIGAEDWTVIEAGVIQRAELLNLVLTDLYGPQTLIQRGLLPPALVHDHPGFLRPVFGALLPGPQQLFTYAADLSRDADGELVVIGDRTQAPSGAAYALQNRNVTSKVLSQLHRQSHVQRLVPYFRALRRGLQQVAPPSATLPRTVLLSAGSRNETAFEHAFLAARLGLSLVEGSDLRMRDGRIWLHALGHPEPVDVIVRRLDEDWCDPLELRPDSLIGVPGLLEAVRTGVVSVVNTIGSGVLENPALHAFMPRIAQHFLGQALRLPGLRTLWLGDPDALREVRGDLSSWVIKPTARSAGGVNAFIGPELSRAERDRLWAKVSARPHRWVAQEPAVPSLAPTLDARGITTRRTLLRTFAVADGETYTVMQGGLTRVAPDDSIVIANHQGAWSKDTWVLGDAPEPMSVFWSEGQPSVVVAPDAAMPSRAAQNLYWLGRYAERAEGVVRLLREIEVRRTEFFNSNNRAGLACLTALLQALTHVTTTYPGFVGPGSIQRLAEPDAELLMVAGDERRPGTLAHAITNLLDTVDTVRDQLSADTWLVVVELQRRVRGASNGEPLGEADDAGDGRQTAISLGDVGSVLHGLLAIQGLAAENMIRDSGWHFMDAGRRIERSLQVLALLRATTTHVREAGAEGLVAESVLRVAESIITYRRRYRSTAQVSTLLDLLLLDADNPRSLSYQMDRLSDDLQHLPGHNGDLGLSASARTVLKATTALRVADTEHLAEVRPGQQVRQELDDFLSHLYELTAQAAADIDRTQFSRPVAQRPLQTGTVGEGIVGQRIPREGAA